MDNEKQKILITGATGGLGEILARKLANKNNILVLTGRNEEKLKSLEKELIEKVAGIEINVLDFSKEEDIKKLSELSKDISIVINCAADIAAKATKELSEVSASDLEKTFRVNVSAPFSSAAGAANNMIKQKFGRVINVGSTSGLSGYSLRPEYCISKFGLRGATEQFNAQISYLSKNMESDIKAFYLAAPPFDGEAIKNVIKERTDVTLKSIEDTRKRYETFNGRTELLKPEEVADKIIELIKPGNEFKETIITF